ncbi:MAG: hypothetical protein JRH11_07810 [Deltaproteobacteria bacterium]|nr:hypothetical protein [Deltaproteobacteria bacterium]
MKTLMMLVALGAASLVPTLAAGSAAAQGNSAVEAARQQMRHEPSVAETVRICLEYFRVDPANFDGLRSAARTRGLLPTLAGGYAYQDDRFTRIEDTLPGGGPAVNPRNEENWNQGSHLFTVGAIWDLRELVFNASEVQVYGLIGVQRDLMLEVTRTYYLRRQLLLRLMLRPPEDPLAYAALEMRVDEFGAILDVLTNGWFSTETESRRASGRGED